jgi:hypothetical protein
MMDYACSLDGGEKECIQNLVEKLPEKCLLGRIMRWEDNIKMGWYYWVSGLLL